MCSCIETLSNKNIKSAKKDHTDNAGAFIWEELREIRRIKMTFSEWRAIARLKANGWKILKGQAYHLQVNKMDGEIYSFKSLPEISAICFKYHLYPDC